MEKLKLLIAAGMALSFTACSVPGTFVSRGNVQKTYQVNGHVIRPQVIQLDAAWFSKNGVNQAYLYTVGPHDILNIIVWDHPELTTPTTQLATPEESGLLVDDKGDIYFPFAGNVKVSGLTVDQIRATITREIAKYIRNPQLSVRVTSFRSKEIQVLGEVNKQGVLPITDKPLTLLDAINQSGGVNTETANTKLIFIVRGPIQHVKIFWVDTTLPTDMVVAQAFPLQNNDIVYVPPADVSSWNRVLGQVLPNLGEAAGTAVAVQDLTN